MSFNTKLKRTDKIKKRIQNLFLNKKVSSNESIITTPLKQKETGMDTIENNLNLLGVMNKRKDLYLK